MDDKFILMMQQRDLPNITGIQKKKEKVLLTRSLLPMALYHVHCLFNHGSVKNELKFIAKNYVTDDVALLKKTLDRFYLQCVHCQRRSLIVR
eukprot:snap_masked-scaffold_1-processed-gene-16.61-mRNA-1 protein AED:0.65 eAED:0.65 QI:0/-1/0/1/-1/1/1/0/91